MPICTNCQTPLPKPSDEYGPRHAPLCLACWLENAYLTTQHIAYDPEFEITALRTMLEKVKADIRGEDQGIRQLRNQLADGYSEGLVEEIAAAENCRDALITRQSELNTRIFNLLQAVKEERLREQAKLIRWTEGDYAR